MAHMVIQDKERLLLGKWGVLEETGRINEMQRG